MSQIAADANAMSQIAADVDTDQERPQSRTHSESENGISTP